MGMLILGTGPLAMNDVNLVRMQAARSTGKAARDTMDDKAEERSDCAEAKADQKVDALENQLEAAAGREKAFFGGLIAGDLFGAASFMANLVSLTATPLGVPLDVLLRGLGSSVLAGLGTAAAGSGLSSAVNEVAFSAPATRRALELEKRSGASDLGAKLAGQEIRSAEELLQTARKEISKIRKAVHKATDDRRRLRTALTDNLSGRGGLIQIGTPGSSALDRATAGYLELMQAEELAAKNELAQSTRDEARSAIEAQQHRARAADIRKRNVTALAWIGLGIQVADLAAQICTLGGASIASAAVKLGGAGANAAGKAFFKDSKATKHDRWADEFDLAAKRASHEAGDARSRLKSATASLERTFDALWDAVRTIEQGGTHMPVGQVMNLGAIQKVRAQSSLEEEQDARADEGVAREEEVEHAEAAIESRKVADQHAAAREERGLMLAFAQVGAAAAGLGGAIGSYTGAITEETSRVISAGGELATSGTNAVLTWVGLEGDTSERVALRQAETLKLREKQAEGRAEDADDAQEAARDRAKRALDAALTMQRNLAPVLV